MLKNILCSAIAVFMLVTNGPAQKVMSLEDCIRMAVENSNTVKLAELGVNDAQFSEKLAKLQRTPFISGSANFRELFGRSIDPTTNLFFNEAIGANSYRIDASATLFNGGRIHNTVKQSAIDVDASNEDRLDAINNLSLMVATAYLQTLQAQEQLANAQSRYNLTADQLIMTGKLIDAGTLPANDSLDIVAQQATNEQAIINAQNQVAISLLNLTQLMELPPSELIEIEKPDLNIELSTDINKINFSEVYTSALGTQPQIRAEDLRVKSAELGVDISKSSLIPQLTAFGNLSTNWSSAVKDFFNYSEQLDNNFSQVIGVVLDVPIYSQGQNSVGIQRAELNVTRAQVQNAQVRQNLSTDVQNAIANAKAAKQSLAAAEKTFSARERAYENAQRRFDLGSINTFDLTTAKNNLDVSEVDLVVAKYEYVFRLKIIDFYMGRPIKLN